ncbi:hypothetical protein FGO68_gene11410 [Halteria grandinella]|uniref:Uncharacterized protein n=1 Tax=Halteria grandinella TaxID=5974 RepID=A0A8J8NWD6_HALGN|nr:hypothetical protein FGO68_gene11410 [Halteria grandinella]
MCNSVKKPLIPCLKYINEACSSIEHPLRRFFNIESPSVVQNQCESLFLEFSLVLSSLLIKWGSIWQMLLLRDFQ